MKQVYFSYDFPNHAIKLELADRYNKFMSDAEDLYIELLENGIPEEEAKNVIPRGCKEIT